MEAKKVLEKEIASVYRRKVTGKETTDKIALERGNYTEVQQLEVLQKARSEVIVSMDFFKDYLNN